MKKIIPLLILIALIITYSVLLKKYQPTDELDEATSIISNIKTTIDNEKID